MYTLLHTEKGYRVLKGTVFFLDGMQLRFLYDLKKALIPHVDMIFLYFDSVHPFEELVALNMVRTRLCRVPAPGEQHLITVNGLLYYQIKASLFKPELTEKGETIVNELKKDALFTECMAAMDQQIATHLTGGPHE